MPETPEQNPWCRVDVSLPKGKRALEVVVSPEVLDVLKVTASEMNELAACEGSPLHELDERICDSDSTVLKFEDTEDLRRIAYALGIFADSTGNSILNIVCPDRSLFDGTKVGMNTETETKAEAERRRQLGEKAQFLTGVFTEKSERFGVCGDLGQDPDVWLRKITGPK